MTKQVMQIDGTLQERSFSGDLHWIPFQHDASQVAPGHAILAETTVDIVFPGIFWLSSDEL